MANTYDGLQTHPGEVARRAGVLLPQDLGQRVLELLSNPNNSTPLAGGDFEQVRVIYEKATLAHPAYIGEIGAYIAIFSERATRSLEANTLPDADTLGDFPEPKGDLDIIQRAQRAAMLRQVGSNLRQLTHIFELPIPCCRVVYDPVTHILGTMSSETEPEQQKCLAFESGIKLPEGTQFGSITLSGSGNKVFFARVFQDNREKVLYISGSDAHNLKVSPIETHGTVLSFMTWGDNPHVVMPDPKNTGEYIHEEGTLEGVFGGDIVVTKDRNNSLVVRDTGGVFTCVIPSNLIPVTEQDGIRLAHKFQAEVNVWPQDNETEPLATFDCGTGFLNFSDFREVAKGAK